MCVCVCLCVCVCGVCVCGVCVCLVIEEQGVRLKLTVTDTPGFGDQVNNDKCWEPIAEYVNEQFDRYLNEEVSINRKKVIPDTRVHCCLYFIPPTGHR